MQLNKNDAIVLLNIIAQSKFSGSDVEEIAELKAKLLEIVDADK